MRTKQVLILGVVLISLILLSVLAATQPDTLMPALNGFIMIALGLALGFYLNHRLGLAWGLFGAGVLTFIGSQVLHIPFNIYLLNPLLERIAPNPASGSNHLAVWGILLGLSAGLFEETARYLVLRFWRRDVQSWKQTLMFGAGHAGIEAILVGMIGFISFIQLAFYRRWGIDSLDTLADSGQAAALQNMIQTYWNYSWYEHLWGSLERFSVIPIHLLATVLVYQSVRRSNLIWYLAAVLWHTLVDFFAVYAGQSWGIPTTEAIIFGLGVFGWVMVFVLRDTHPPPEPQPEDFTPETIPPAARPTTPVSDQPITKESLEESRYE